MKRIDLNVDIGEGFPWDRELLEFATSANVCCGAHAGSPELALETVKLCEEMGVRAGAHPGYPDRKHFGRRSWANLSAEQQMDFVEGWREQIHPLWDHVAYIKPHGGFYNDSARSSDVRSTLMMMLATYRLPLMGLEKTNHRMIAQNAVSSFIREGFADRKYTEDGFLVNRSEPGAVLETMEEKVAQALWLADRVDSICLHGDEEDSVEVIRAVRSALEDSGWEVCAFEPDGR